MLRTGRIYNATPSLFIDQVWKDEQLLGNGWYVSQPILGKQRCSFSDPLHHRRGDAELRN